MRNLFPLFALCAAAATFSSAYALESDRDQPMNIEANTMRHDDVKQVTDFSGSVVVTKGTIILRGDTLTVEQRPDGSQFGVARANDGKRAFFSQQKDTPKGAPVEIMEAQAQRIEHDTKANTVRLLGNAQLRRLVNGQFNDEINGAEILYYSNTGMFTVDGAARATDNAGGSGRVRAVIGASTTNKNTPSSAAPASGAGSVELKPSSSLSR